MWSTGGYDFNVRVFDHCVRIEAIHSASLKTWLAEVLREQTLVASGGLTDTCSGFAQFFKDALHDGKIKAKLVSIGDKLHFIGTVVTVYGSRNVLTIFSPLAISDFAKLDEKLEALQATITQSVNAVQSITTELRRVPPSNSVLAPELVVLTTIPRFEVWIRYSGGIRRLLLHSCESLGTPKLTTSYQTITLHLGGIEWHFYQDYPTAESTLNVLQAFEPVAVLYFREESSGGSDAPDLLIIVSKTQLGVKAASTLLCAPLEPGPPVIFSQVMAGREPTEVCIIWPPLIK